MDPDIQSVALCDAARCFDLIEQCGELWYDPAAWQGHFASGIDRLIGGCGGSYYLVHRVVNGVPHIREAAAADNTDPAIIRMFERYLQAGGIRLDPDLEIITPVILRDRELTYRMGDILSRRQLHRSAMYQSFLREFRLEDCIASIQLRGDGLAFGTSIHRQAGERAFTGRDRAMLGLLTLLVSQRAGDRLVTPGQTGIHNLSPRLREVLHCLLEGAPDKEIAARLKISRGTVHEYVMAVLRHFGTGSRARLLALFARRGSLPGAQHLDP